MSILQNMDGSHNRSDNLSQQVNFSHQIVPSQYSSDFIQL